MHIAFVVYSFSTGGAQTVISTMANYLTKNYDVSIITFTASQPSEYYKLSKEINFIPLGIDKESSNPLSAVLNNVYRILYLRKVFLQSQADLIISFLDKPNIITLLSTINTSIPVIVSQRSDPRYNNIGKAWKILRKHTYSKLTKCIVLQTDKYIDFFPTKVHKKISIIPNPVLPPTYHTLKKPDIFTNKYFSIVSVGRLEYPKGHDILVKAFSSISKIFPSWNLIILGEGEMRSSLEHMINHLKLNEKVFLPGEVNNIYDYLKHADIFVLPSRREGFPNALCEAMACGLPVVAFDCPSGPSDIIDNHINGILVSQTESSLALSTVLEDLMSDGNKRKLLAQNSAEIIERFSLDKVMSQWEFLVNQLL